MSKKPTYRPCHPDKSERLDINGGADKTSNQTTLACPSCSRLVVWTSANPHRPFCSDRCQLLDLGAWAGEQHCIAGEPVYAEAQLPTSPEYEYN